VQSLPRAAGRSEEDPSAVAWVLGRISIISVGDQLDASATSGWHRDGEAMEVRAPEEE